MKAEDVSDTLDLALGEQRAGLGKCGAPSAVAFGQWLFLHPVDLAEWLEDKKIENIRGTLYHPQTQAKIERWHQTLKNSILLNNYYLPRELEADCRLRGKTTIISVCTRA